MHDRGADPDESGRRRSVSGGAAIPPRSRAVPSDEPVSPTQRDRHLTMITDHGRLARQAATGYGRRSLVETTMGCYKSLIGPRLHARGFAAQQTEATIGVGC
jgi:hypothetical protein